MRKIKGLLLIALLVIVSSVPAKARESFLSQEIIDLCIKYEAENCIDRYLLMAFCEIESHGQTDIVSANGQYIGLMQLNKDYFTGDLTDAENNISQGSAYLSELKYKHGIFKAISYYSGENGKIGYYSKKIIYRWFELEEKNGS